MNISRKCGACSNQRHRPYHFLQDHKPARGAISSFFGKRTFRGISESLHNSTTRLAGIREGQESLEKGATEGTAPLEGNSPAKAAESRADDVSIRPACPLLSDCSHVYEILTAHTVSTRPQNLQIQASMIQNSLRHVVFFFVLSS